MKTNHLNSSPIKRINKKFLFATVFCSLTAANVIAGTQSATVQVSATVGTVAGACTVTIGSLAFGSYSGVEVEAALEFGVDCGQQAIPWSLVFDGGGTGDSSNRAMLGALQGGSLTYQLTDASLVPITNTPFSVTGDLAYNPYIRGVIESGQTVPDDSYADSINVTLTF